MEAHFEVATFVLGATQLIKMMELLPDKYLPFVATVLGMVIYVITNNSYDNPVSYLEGLFVGMTTAGVVNYVNTKLAPDKAKLK